MSKEDKKAEDLAVELLNKGMILSEVEKKVGYELIAFKDIDNKYIRVNLWKVLI